MTTASNYRTEAVNVGANTYSTPVDNSMGEALAGAVNTFGTIERNFTKEKVQQAVQAESDNFFGSLTEAQKDYAELKTSAVEGGELTPEARARLQQHESESGVLQEALEQGRIKYHQFAMRQEGLLRSAKQQRPDLADEFDGIYAKTLGFDVRGASMDYYNFLLNKTENKIGQLQAQEKNASDAFAKELAVSKEILKGLPADIQGPMVEQLLNVAANHARGSIGTTEASELLTQLVSPHITTASREVADARIRTQTTIGAVHSKANEIYIAGQKGLLKSNPDGSLDSSTIESLSTMEKQVMELNVEAERIRPSSPETANAIVSQAKFLQDQLAEVRKQNSVTGLLASSKAIVEIQGFNLPASEEGRLHNVSRIISQEPAERTKWVKEIAPSITLGKHLAEQARSGGVKPWEMKFSSSVQDKVSGTTVSKLFSNLATHFSDKGDIVPILSGALYSHGAQRVNANGSVVLRSPTEIFDSGGALYKITANDFVNTEEGKKLMRLSPNERQQIAIGLAMNLDRYNEYVVGAAHSNDPSVPNKAVRPSQMLDLMLNGKIASTTKYAVGHSSIKASSLAPYDVYSKEASDSWSVIMALVQ